MNEGNGVRDLAHQMVETKERAFAWLIRALIVFGGFTITTMLGMGLYIFNDLKTQVSTNNQYLWSAQQKTQSDLTSAVGRLTTLSDQVKNSFDRQTDAFNRIEAEEKDHEDRLRNLERGTHG